MVDENYLYLIISISNIKFTAIYLDFTQAVLNWSYNSLQPFLSVDNFNILAAK